MLQIQNIRKQYKTGDLVQVALDGVSLTLRDNEFVAILGPSGSGKTTLLNVIGGLDRYDSGDLIIKGISTKKYSDRDWDSYRNHTIGFVFQSYNLIPHQTVLANVELALTISGISRGERRRRAKEALTAVGLGNQLHKKPNQMSGGQMQRVAIARALVNNPDILLADEPTGALDSETSVQIMELLKEVARDRLVVMVTHNPELAEEYANRIVRVKDGRIIGDTNPCDAIDTGAATHKNMGRSSMSLLTAAGLSFNNLLTKKGRTLLTAFAGSIGIIGIALILALSTGFQAYIDKIQEDTLSNYPLTIQSDTADISTAFMSIGAQVMDSQTADDGVVKEAQMITQVMGQMGSNDLKSFKAHLDLNYADVADAINYLDYSYGITPLIYAADTTQKITQVNPASLFADLTGSAMLSSYMDSNVFYEILDDPEMLSEQYEVLKGRWPEHYNEMVMVLSDPHMFTDYMAYTLGMRDSTELEGMVEQLMEGEEPTITATPMTWTYDELMALDFRLVHPCDLYQYNAEYSVWEDLSDDKVHLRQMIAEGEQLKIVGIVCPKSGSGTAALSQGIAYTPALIEHIIEAAGSTRIVHDQLLNRKIDVFTGKDFGADDEEGSGLNFEDMISIDEELLKEAFGGDVDTTSVMTSVQEHMSTITTSIDADIRPAQTALTDTYKAMAAAMLTNYIEERVSQTFWTPSKIWDNLPNIIEPSNTDGVITMARNKLVGMIGKLSEDQVERLSGIAMEYLDLNIKVEDTAPKSCPCCGAANAHFIKRGFSGRKQRYQCKSCGKRFTFDAGKLTAYSHQTEEAWATFIRDTLSLKSLDECAANISVSHPTSFYMRHKLLSFLEEALKEGEMLEGIVEADEAYVLESQKGIPVTTRKPRKHGEPATKRGLSDEQMCICVAADREGRVVARCVNRAKPTADNIQEALGVRIGENGVFLCDGATAYNKLIETKNCQKIVLNNHKDYNKAYHLNTVNGLHSRLKAMLYRYRAVSSKYLNRYLALFTALEQAGRSVFHPEIDSVRQMIAKVNAIRHIRKLSTEAVLAF